MDERTSSMNEHKSAYKNLQEEVGAVQSETGISAEKLQLNTASGIVPLVKSTPSQKGSSTRYDQIADAMGH